MTVELTKDAKRLLAELLKQYKLQIADGQSRRKAKYVDSPEYVYENIIAEYSIEDLIELFHELDRAGYLECSWNINGQANFCSLTDRAIIYMENKFENDLNKIIDYISKISTIRQIIPSLK